MSLLKKITNLIAKRKVQLRITLPWFGERKLPAPKIHDKPVTIEEIRREITKEKP